MCNFFLNKLVHMINYIIASTQNCTQMLSLPRAYRIQIATRAIARDMSERCTNQVPTETTVSGAHVLCPEARSKWWHFAESAPHTASPERTGGWPNRRKERGPWTLSVGKPPNSSGLPVRHGHEKETALRCGMPYQPLPTQSLPVLRGACTPTDAGRRESCLSFLR